MKRKRETPFAVRAPENSTGSLSPRQPDSLIRSISPPPVPARKFNENKSIAAQVEAGDKNVEDHLAFFSTKLSASTRSSTGLTPRLGHQSWIDLYKENDGNPRGHHFVIHQHDHPVAGTHYDLRLQCNETSSVSWAIMYGLPGDPNSRHLNRNATETRIHCLWNHLIETASHQTGTLLIWDTGTYEVLPYRTAGQDSKDVTSNEDDSETENHAGRTGPGRDCRTETEKLHDAFQNRRIRLRLHGTRLPVGYTLSLWLRRENDRAEQPPAPKFRRKKGVPSMKRNMSDKDAYNTDTENERDSVTDSSDNFERSPSPTATSGLRRSISSLHRCASPPALSSTSNLTTDSSSPSKLPKALETIEQVGTQHYRGHASSKSSVSHSISRSKSNRTLDYDQDTLIRQTNAYPGAANTINSVHQRRWYLCMDRPSSGFVKSKARGGKWISNSDHLCESDAGRSDLNREVESTFRAHSGRRLQMKQSTPQPQGFESFHVLGRDHERSVVTGRLAAEILADEGVKGYVPRGKWRAIIE